MLSDFIEGSDPCLAVAENTQLSPGVVAFGQDAKSMIVTHHRASEVAVNCSIRVEGLGGTNGGVIGAVAVIGLASIQNEGGFLLKGRNRELSGVRSVEEIVNAGIDQVMTLQGEALIVGSVKIPKNATPSFIGGKAVLFVEQSQEGFTALKRA